MLDEIDKRSVPGVIGVEIMAKRSIQENFNHSAYRHKMRWIKPFEQGRQYVLRTNPFKALVRAVKINEFLPSFLKLMVISLVLG